MDIRIRLAGAGDEGVMAALNATVHGLHVAHEPRFFKTTQLPEVTRWFAEFVARPNNRAWIAYADGSPIGYVTVEAKHRKSNVFSSELWWWEVDQVAVRGEYQRHGVASALIREVSEAAVSEGIQELQLSTWEFNSQARMAFERLGFAPIQHRFVRRLRGDR